MMNPFTHSLAAAATALTFATAAFVGAQYVDEAGIARFGDDVAVYFGLDQNTVGQSQSAGVQGKVSISADYKGAIFSVAAEENQNSFLTGPVKYARQNGGHYAFGLAKGGQVASHPGLRAIVEDKQNPNMTKNMVVFGEKDIPGNLNAPENNRASLDAVPASDRVVPHLTSAAPQK